MSRFLPAATCASALLATACGGGSPGRSNCPAAPTVVAANQNYPAAAAADNRYVYWLGTADAGSTERDVMRAPADKCKTTPGVFASGGGINGLTLNADSVFWCDADGIESRPKAGGATTLLAKRPAADCPMFADATDVFFTSAAGIEKLDLASRKRSVVYSGTDRIVALAASARSVYFVAGDSVWRVPRAGGARTAIATNQLIPSDIAVNATDVYWVDAGNHGVDTWTGGGSVMGEPLAGGTPRAIAGDLVGPTSIAVDSKNAFVGGHPGEAESVPLLRVPLSGGTPVTLVSTLTGQGGGAVAVNHTAVFFLMLDSVNRVAKSYSP